jgi:hypothetical protein
MNKYQIQLTPEQTLTHLTTIASSLVASGYFPCDPDPDLVDEYSFSASVAAVASNVLRALMDNVEGEINEGNLDRYIDAGDPRHNYLPGSDNERRQAWLKNPVAKQPDSCQD